MGGSRFRGPEVPRRSAGAGGEAGSAFPQFLIMYGKVWANRQVIGVFYLASL